MEQKTIGSFIATLRKANGLTQKQLAEKLGVSDKTISHWERDESAPDLSILPILADIFGVTCDELLRGEKRNSETQAPEENAFSKKSEKQIGYLLDKALSNHTVLSIIGSAVSVIGLILFFILSHYSYPYIDFAVSSVVFITSAILIWLSNFIFTQKFKGEEFKTEKVKEAIKKANSFTFYSFAVWTVCFVIASGKALEFSLAINVSYLILPLVLVCAFFLDLILKEKGKIFSKLNKEQIKRFFKFRLCTLIAAAVIFSVPTFANQGIMDYGTRMEWKEVHSFSTVEEFKSFMETEEAKPSGADEFDKERFYRITNLHDRGLQFLDRTDVKGKNVVLNLYDSECDVKKDVLFTWNNENVMGIEINGYFSEENEHRNEVGGREVFITAYTYSYAIKQMKIESTKDILEMISLVYYPAFAVIFVAVYFSRSKKIRTEK